MRATYDPEAEAVYVYLADNEHARTVELAEGVNVDLDEDELPIGVEVLNVRAGSASDEGSPTRADIEWLVWFARKSKGKASEVAQMALDQNPGLRPGGWAGSASDEGSLDAATLTEAFHAEFCSPRGHPAEYDRPFIEKVAATYARLRATSSPSEPETPR